MTGPAYRIETPRLVLRCWDPADAPALSRAIEESLEHLRAWMPWAWHEPEALPAKLQRLRLFRGNFDLDKDFAYGIFSLDEAKVLGGSGLHPRVGEGAREIGYWIHAAHTGHGYATEAAAALTRVAFEVDGMRRVEIHSDPRNTRSAAIPRRLSFTHEATLRARSLSETGAPSDSMIWSLLREEYAGSAAAAVEVRAYDALGGRLL